MIYNKYTKNNKKETDILLELYRGKEFCNIHNIFIKSCLSNLGEKVFSNKKNYIRTISNLLSSWMFTLYSKYNFSEDPFFPTKYKNFKNLKETLYDYCSLFKIENKDEKIENIINDLDTIYGKSLDNISNYEKSDFYKKNKDKIMITKKIIEENRNKISINFYKFEIKTYFNIYLSNTKLINIINNLILPIDVYDKMIKRYDKKFSKNIDYLIWIILYRYQLLSSNNNQLAVLPSVLNKMEKEFNLNFETFASSINTNSNQYCSLYYDVEKYFGSVGNFFNTVFLDGCYSFNPPYQKDIIENGLNKILNELHNSDILNLNLTFIITIPIWDIQGKNKMKSINSKNNNDNIKYGDMKIINKIKKCKYFRELKMISKNNFTYIDYNFHLFKNTTIQNTYIIILSNDSNEYIEKLKNYDFFNY